MSHLSPVKTMKALAFNGKQITSRLAKRQCRPPIKRAVSFGAINVCEFAPVIGDNPFVSKGAPIALGTKKICEISVPVDDYEQIRQPLRRHGSRLAMKPKERAARLLSEGYAKQDINNAALAAWTAKRSIEQSANQRCFDKFSERFEATTRLLQKVMMPIGRGSRPLPRRSLSFQV